jgi:uncharacterized membrane protein
MTHPLTPDEDPERHWYLRRLVYANPADPRLLVPQRNGFYSSNSPYKPSEYLTPNLGNWRTWLVLLLVCSPIIVILAAVRWGGW